MKAKPARSAANKTRGQTNGLKERFGSPPGPAFETLWDLRGDLSAIVDDQDLFYLLSDDDERDMRAYCHDEYGIALVGRSHNRACFFGVPLGMAGATTLDEVPIVVVDDKGTDPEVATKNLADFLSLVAYSPESWGSTPAEWKKCAKECLEGWPKDVARLRKLLLRVPGVVVPEEPWKLQRKLPKVQFRPRAGTKAAARATHADLRKTVESLFNVHAAKVKLLLAFDEIQEQGSDVQIAVLVDAPEEAAETLAAHPLVRDTLKAFLAGVREALPDKRFSLGLAFESLSDNPDAAWKRLRIALEHAGARDLYAKLATTIGASKRKGN